MAAADYVSTRLTTAVVRVDGPMGTTHWLNDKPYSWLPAPRDIGEKPMLYTRTQDAGDGIVLSRGKRVTTQEYNEAVGALLH